MPELPDLNLYVDAISGRVLGQSLMQISVFSPFLLRTVAPPIGYCAGRRVEAVRRLGKRILIILTGGPVIALHLMIAGRLRWHDDGAKQLAVPGKIILARLEFTSGCITLIEAGTQKRAAMHILHDEGGLGALHAGGLEPLECGLNEFTTAVVQENRTLKRALTDPRTLAGIGNAYSDEILHVARLSPMKLTGSLTPEEIARLHAAMRATLQTWCDRLTTEFAGRFPEIGDITAFRPAFVVHGKYNQPCPVCGTKVQRITYANKNDLNYCPTCQTGGKVLADRALSRLLKAEWPKTAEDLE